MVQRGFVSLGIQYPNIPGNSALTSFGSPVFGPPRSQSSPSRDDPIPSYEESVRSLPQSNYTFISERNSSSSRPTDPKANPSALQAILPTQIASVREHRIQSLIDT